MLQARPDRSGKQEQEKNSPNSLKVLSEGVRRRDSRKVGLTLWHSPISYLIPDNAFLWEEWGQSEEEERGELVWDVERLQIFL